MSDLASAVFDLVRIILIFGFLVGVLMLLGASLFLSGEHFKLALVIIALSLGSLAAGGSLQEWIEDHDLTGGAE